MEDSLIRFFGRKRPRVCVDYKQPVLLFQILKIVLIIRNDFCADSHLGKLNPGVQRTGKIICNDQEFIHTDYPLFSSLLSAIFAPYSMELSRLSSFASPFPA